MTKLLLAVIGLLVIAVGILAFMLWDTKYRDSGLTVQLGDPKLSDAGYEVRMEAAGKVNVIDSGPFRGKRIPLVFTVTSNGNPAPGLTLYTRVEGPVGSPSLDSMGRLEAGIPDRRITFPTSGNPFLAMPTDAKGQVKAQLSLLYDGPGSIIPITISVYRDKTKLGQVIKTITLE